MSSGYRRRQPWLTSMPMPHGMLVPWIAYSVSASSMRWLPSGLSAAPPAMNVRLSPRSAMCSRRIDGGMFHCGFSVLPCTRYVPRGVRGRRGPCRRDTSGPRPCPARPSRDGTGRAASRAGSPRCRRSRSTAARRTSARRSRCRESGPTGRRPGSPRSRCIRGRTSGDVEQGVAVADAGRSRCVRRPSRSGRPSHRCRARRTGCPSRERVLAPRGCTVVGHRPMRATPRSRREDQDEKSFGPAHPAIVPVIRVGGNPVRPNRATRGWCHPVRRTGRRRGRRGPRAGEPSAGLPLVRDVRSTKAPAPYLEPADSGSRSPPGSERLGP